MGVLRKIVYSNHPGGDMRFSYSVVIRGTASPNQFLLNLAEVNGSA